jgi:hypothetical protein
VARVDVRILIVRIGSPSPAVVGAEIESETRRGRDFVRVTITAAVDAVDVAAALSAARDVFGQAGGDDAAGWDMVAASAARPSGSAAEVAAVRVRELGAGQQLALIGAEENPQ